ncbi:MAG: HAD family phosphatase [Gammaproteobacteria bacterium]
MQRVITTLIFDLDGTLADTEILHCRAYQQALSSFGIAISEGAYEEHWIRQGKNIDEYVAEHELDVDPDVIREEKARHFENLARTEARPMPGVHAALDRLRWRNRLVLATSSYRDAATAVLDSLQIAEMFEYIATKENAARVKPAPDVHLHVLEKLRARPQECLVVEDAEKGVKAATAAGLRCVAIPNPLTADHDFSAATLVLDSISELTPERLRELGQRALETA